MAKKKRVRQTYIPGTEPLSIPAIDKQADYYMDRRDTRMTLGQEEKQEKQKLLDLMKEHGLYSYEFDGFLVTRTEEQDIKVRKKKKEKDNGAE
jgi:hypothetical protein